MYMCTIYIYIYKYICIYLHLLVAATGLDIAGLIPTTTLNSAPEVATKTWSLESQ